MEARNDVSRTKTKRSVACGIPSPRRRIHLLAVEEDDKFNGVDERKQGAKESPRPHHSLTVDQHQNVGGDDKLLPSQLLHQRIGRVVHHHPVARAHTHRQTWCSHTACQPTDVLSAGRRVPAWNLHQHQRSDGDKQVKHGQLVHLLPHARFPALTRARRR